MSSTVSIAAYKAKRYVIACRTPKIAAKLFQIAFGRDGSLYVSIPYYKETHGTVGIVEISSSLRYPTSLTVGEKFPVTGHSVKYSHHPSGRAHFSLTGKVRSIVGKNAVPLDRAEGHIFTLMAYNLKSFAALTLTERATADRGIVPFGLATNEPAQVKFVGHLYSDREVAKRFVFRSQEQVWIVAQAPDGTRKIGILLITPFEHSGRKYFLFLTMEEVMGIEPKPNGMINLIGGFDPPEIAGNHSKDTSFLFCAYPTSGDFEELVRNKGTIDLDR